MSHENGVKDLVLAHTDMHFTCLLFSIHFIELVAIYRSKTRYYFNFKLYMQMFTYITVSVEVNLSIQQCQRSLFILQLYCIQIVRLNNMPNHLDYFAVQRNKFEHADLNRQTQVTCFFYLT